jgi:NAD-dependent SIR2 family protein deacetylase
MRTVLFTGAGASRAIGYPLTKELLPLVRTSLKNGTLFNQTARHPRNEECRKDLRRMLGRLLPGFNKVGDRDLPLITDLFSLVEYAILSGETLSIGGEQSLRRCRDLLKQAMTDVFIENFRRSYDRDDPEEKREEDLLHQLLAWIKRQRGTLGIVTTNYDIGIEFEMARRGALSAKGLDIGFDWRHPDNGRIYTRPAKPSFRYYKLHGSFNMLHCGTCGHVYFNPWGSIVHQVFRPKIDWANTCHCRDDVRLEMHLVSPSLVRDIRDANLLSTWRSALEWMRRADRWVIVGYSLPQEDLAIRSLILRAYATAEKKPSVTVVQQGQEAEPRYRLLFPKYKFKYRGDGLGAFLSEE